jgi:gluconokinase
MNYYLGVDIGTTSLKAVAFSSNGDVLSKHSISYEMRHPQPHWSEQDPNEILKAVINGINIILQSLAPAQPVVISFSAMMHTLIVVDKAGEPLTNCWIWADNRAGEQAELLRGTEKGKKFYHATGVPIHAMSPLCKLLWLKEHDAETFRNAHKFISIKEFIFFKLFGEYVVDTAIASASGLLNLQQLSWDDDILDHIGVPREKLSTVVSVKEIFWYCPDKHPRLLNLPAKTPFVTGGSDGATANLGAGVTGKHSMVVTIGTSCAARLTTQAPETDKLMRTFCYHSKDNYYIVGGASNNGAVVLEWLKDTLLQSGESYQQLFNRVKDIPAGCDDLLFLPYILGERAPIWNAYAKGIFFGVTINHTKGHMIRSAMEGIIYSLYSIGSILMQKREVTEIHATGGFARNPLWVQMLADIFNTRVIFSDAVESSAWGAVILGMEALQVEYSFKKKVLSVHEPDASRHSIYMKQFEKFERIYELLKDEFKKEAVLLHQLI